MADMISWRVGVRERQSDVPSPYGVPSWTSPSYLAPLEKSILPIPDLLPELNSPS